MGEALVWVFGYGSLLWRPGFTYVEAIPVTLGGYARRFWQGSPDHRGTPALPGRVVTLVEAAGEACWGIAYAIDRTVADETFGALDHRERAGYERREVTLVPLDATRSSFAGVVYVATEKNADYLGAAAPDEVAERVVVATGPSGPNVDYVERLAGVLSAHEVRDAHVVEVLEAVRRRLALLGARAEPRPVPLLR